MDATTRYKDYELRVSVVPSNGVYVPKMSLQRATGGPDPSLLEVPNVLGGFVTAQEATSAALQYLRDMADGKVSDFGTI